MYPITTGFLTATYMHPKARALLRIAWKGHMNILFRVYPTVYWLSHISDINQTNQHTV